MKVAMDATPLTLSSGGITRYTAELGRALAVSFPEDEVVLVSDQPFPMPSPAPVNLRCGNGPCRPWENRWWLYGLPREMLRQGSEVFHGTHFVVPWLPLWPSVVTIHDLSPWMEPGWHCHAELVRRRAPVLIKLGIATMVVTPSEAVRRQVIERFGIHPGRIVSVPLAASPHFRPVPQTRPSTRYFLFVGTLEPRKNLETLAEAWRAVRKDHDVDLILAGRSRSDAPSLTSEPGLRILGEVDERDLPALYSSALACVYPSLYEGFGLPVLEAMQCGTAVLTSRDPAIRELAGGAAVQVEARDTKAWVEAMTAAVTQPDRLGTWREKALERAKSFSWDRTATLTREVYTEAIRRSEGER